MEHWLNELVVDEDVLDIRVSSANASKTIWFEKVWHHTDFRANFLNYY